MITGATVGGGLLVGVGGIGAHLLMHNRINTQREANNDDNAIHINLWLRITPDNFIELVNPHADMGQGSSTGLLQIVAEELDADWSQMRVIQAPAETAYSNGKVFEGFVRELIRLPDWADTLVENGFYRAADLMKMQMTSASTAVRFTGWEVLRKAASATRSMLLSAAVNKLDVSEALLTTQSGFVKHEGSGTTFSYGELATAAALLDSPETVQLKSADQYSYVGMPMPRVDIPAKVFANANYGIDAAVPGMRYAAVAPSAVFGAEVDSINNLDEIMAVKGVSDVLIVPQGVAVVADNPWRAEKAVRSVKFTRQSHKNEALDTNAVIALQQNALAEKLPVAEKIGKPETIDATMSVEYQVPYLAHATLEPMNATVWQQEGKLHIICGVQNPLNARVRAAKEAGLALDDVVLHTRQLGGGFGRRAAITFSNDEPLNWLVQAVRIALDSGKAVKTCWSREMDMRSDVYRPLVVAQYEGALADNGKPLLWRSRSFGNEMDIRMLLPPYEIPNISISFADKAHPIPIGLWRSVEHSQHAFFIESYIDELSAAAGVDPLQYRLSLLNENSPAANVLNKVAEMSAWRYGTDDQNRAMGVSLVKCFGSVIAQVVEASIKSGVPKVHRVWCAVDCGVAVNPQAIEAQVQGAVNFALSAALYGKCEIQSGAVVQSNFHDYRLVNLSQAPRIEVELLNANSPIGGVGEIGVPPLAPALCNALSVINGKRHRTLPLV